MPTATTFLDGDDARGLGQSALAYHFLGGLLAHARALTALIAPTVNCYKRLSVGGYLTGARSGFTWTPAFITFGDNNRTQMFRTPEPGRFECRTVRRRQSLPRHGRLHRRRPRWDRTRARPRRPLIGRNMYETALEDARTEGLRFIPQSLAEAIDEFEQDRSSIRARDELARVHRRQTPRVGAHHNTVGRWEIDEYLTLF